MDNNDNKAKIAIRRKRNLVAKNNRLRARTHKSAKEYSRKEKYPLGAM